MNKIREQIEQLQERTRLHQSLPDEKMMYAAAVTMEKMLAVVEAANNLSHFIAMHEYPELESNEFHRFTELADKQDTIVRAVLEIRNRAELDSNNG